MALQEHASIWANSALICIKDITFLLPVWNIFCLFCPPPLHRMQNISSFVTCSQMLLSWRKYTRFLQYHFTMCQLLYWSPLTSPQIRCQLKSTTAHKISRARSFIASASPHGCARKKKKLSGDPFACFDFLLPTLCTEKKKKITQNIFTPYFPSKTSSIPSFHSICESGFMCCQFFTGKILFGADMARTKQFDCR